MKARLLSLFRTLPIAHKFTFSVVLLILVIMITVNALIITHQSRALREEMEGSHLLIVRDLAKNLVEPLMFLDPLKLDELLLVTAQTPGCVYVMASDRTGRVVAHTDRKLLGTVFGQYVVGKSPDISEVKRERIAESPETVIREIQVPVKIGYEQIGTVVAGFSKERIEGLIAESLRGLEQYIFIISGIILITGIGGAVLLARVITTPMRNLKEKMEQIRSGNLDVISVGPVLAQLNASGDELGELIRTFDEMVLRLRASLDELEKSNSEKARLEKLSALGEMSMTVAHEVKNPLNAIRGAVSYLKDNFEGEVLREFLLIIEQETARLNEIVTQYLVFAKPTPLKLRTADLNRVVSDVVNLVRQEATENNVELLMDLDERAAPCSFDLQQIKQALLNILVNALDATRAGDTIRVYTAARDGHVDVIIRDTGPGISEEVIPDIFKPFYTTKTRGSGLGLACVERIVRDHHGEIVVKTDQGKGTEFIISLPMERKS